MAGLSNGHNSRGIFLCRKKRNKLRNRETRKEILNRRFTKGEISQEEYEEQNEILILKSSKMKTIVKILLIIGVIGSLTSCKSTFNASETMAEQENRNAVYQEIISSPSQFNEFIDLAQQDEGARKLMMKNHMQMMESGKMKTMMENNPEMKEKMKAHMQKMMEENPEMKKKMQTMMLAKMMESEPGRKMLMDEIHNNKMMKEEMKAKMMQMMNENPEMMEEMKQKMMEKNPEMMKKMKGKMKNEK